MKMTSTSHFIDVTELAMEEFKWPSDTATAAELSALAAKYDEDFFIGMTASGIRAWYIKNTDAAGKPIKIGTELKPEDQAKVDKLKDAEKAILADVITGATMSLHDGQGIFLDLIFL